MSYYIIKNLKLDGKNNKIGGSVADSSVTDDNGKNMFGKYEDDLYPEAKTWEEKYAHFVSAIITGGVEIQGNNKLKRLAFTYRAKELENYYEDLKKLGYVPTYNKYKNVIEEILNEEKNYIIKFYDNRYLKKINTKTYECTYFIEQAKKYTKRGAENISGIARHSIVSYDKELYAEKEEKFKLFIESIVRCENGTINEEDLKDFIKNRCIYSKFDGIFLYEKLSENYPENKLVNEMKRVSYGITMEKLITEGKSSLTKEEYDSTKKKLKILKDNYKYDYDYKREMQLLESAFKEKYISIELEEQLSDEIIEEINC